MKGFLVASVVWVGLGGWAVGQDKGSVANTPQAGKVVPSGKVTSGEDTGIKLDATPALWRVKANGTPGAKGTVWLFGSVHVMKKEVHWESPKVKAALQGSDVLYLEVADIGPEAMQAMQPLVMKLGIDAEHPLSTKISKEDVALLDATVKGLGMPGESALEPMQPWLVSLTLGVLPAMKAGYDLSAGIDQMLLAEARAENKPVKGFETAEEQMHVLADFPQADQVAMLHRELEDMPKAQRQVDEMVADWTRGEVDKIGAMENDEMKLKEPALYDKLLVKRNEHFADVLAALLKDPATGTVFVTVGAGHLAGADSVIRMLEKRGYTATREE